ncbi:hypothetical protein [Streptomyces sp. NPDC001480]|uniref:hypothetical protein n=1 Tax=Streptomyces sp. NPDC001480 TaxID=3364577 RepID=UPI0036778ED1
MAVDYSGDTNALRRAVVSRIYGFDIGIHNSFGLEMYLFHQSAMLLVSACPAIPMGAVNGSTQNINGIATRMLIDYDFGKKADTIGLDTMYGLATVKEDPDFAVRGTASGEKFVRGLKISITETASVGRLIPLRAGAPRRVRLGAPTSRRLRLAVVVKVSC